jgi:hypothetical protein
LLEPHRDQGETGKSITPPNQICRKINKNMGEG